MPKARPQLDPANPLHGFALELRSLRLHAGDPPLGELARAMACSHSTVSAYLNGRRLPLPRQLRSFVRACKGNPEEWLERLEVVRDQLDRMPTSEAPKPINQPHGNGIAEHSRSFVDYSTDAIITGGEDVADATVRNSSSIQSGPVSAANRATGALYQIIAEDLMRQIVSGQLGPGEKLKTELELKEQYNASRNTVRDAIQHLATLGLIETRAGRGTFVSQADEPIIAPAVSSGSTEGLDLRAYSALTRTPQSSEPDVEMVTASGIIPEQLRVARRSQLVRRRQKRWIDGIPWSLQATFYPMELVHKGATRLLEIAPIAGGTASYLEHILGINVAKVRDEISVRRANSEELDFFRIDDGSVVEVNRTAYDLDGHPVLLTITAYLTDGNRLVYEV